MDLCKYTEELWRLYSLGSIEEIEAHVFDRMSDDVVIIGTGKHEVYKSLEAFRQSVSLEEEERSQIRFRIENFSCSEKQLNDHTSLVCGELHLVGIGLDENVLVDMDTRFSMLYLMEDGDWKLVHIHQSIPYAEQMEGEYYPKTLMDQVSELALLVKTDLLTGVLNHQTFYGFAAQLSESESGGYFMVIDLDDFKLINDTHGHLYGDRVLKEIGAVLNASIGTGDFAGRIGGDEFALYLSGLPDDAAAERMAAGIIRRIAEKGNRKDCVLPGISIGIAPKRAGESSMEAIRYADANMYEAKRSGKNRYKI